MVKDNSNLYVLSIVALVAVVGLVTLFLGNSADAPDMDAGDLVGQAISDGQVGDGVSKQRILVGEEVEGKKPFVSREESRERQIEEQKRIDEAINK